MSNEQPSYYAIIPANVRYDNSLKANEKLLYGEITCLSQSSGKCFATNSYFSNLYGVSKTSISKWISNLVKCGYVKSVVKYRENTKQIEVRYLTIVQHPIEEKLKGGIEEKLKGGIEEKLKGNNTSINNTSINIEKDFDSFYSSYPNKQNRSGAFKAFKKLNPDKETLEKIKSFVDKALKSGHWDINEKKFIPHPATFINGQRWNDDIIPKQQQPQPNQTKSGSSIKLLGGDK